MQLCYVELANMKPWHSPFQTSTASTCVGRCLWEGVLGWMRFAVVLVLGARADFCAQAKTMQHTTRSRSLWATQT